MKTNMLAIVPRVAIPRKNKKGPKKKKKRKKEKKKRNGKKKEKKKKAKGGKLLTISTICTYYSPTIPGPTCIGSKSAIISYAGTLTTKKHQKKNKKQKKKTNQNWSK